jgi:hypothetical protein
LLANRADGDFVLCDTGPGQFLRDRLCPALRETLIERGRADGVGVADNLNRRP